jgi:hypothetical protein
VGAVHVSASNQYQQACISAGQASRGCRHNFQQCSIARPSCKHILLFTSHQLLHHLQHMFNKRCLFLLVICGAELLHCCTVLCCCCWLQPGADAESSRVNHSFSADEKRKLNVYESIDYFAPNSAVYRRWLARQVRSSSSGRRATPMCTKHDTTGADTLQVATCLTSHGCTSA